ncbi:hypothetical protein BD410DRAFT_760868, partial [Rickenella mellea]
MDIFYKMDGKAEVINLANVTAVQLDALALACKKNTGGGGLDASKFSINVFPELSGLSAPIKAQILSQKDREKDIIWKIDALRVYTGKDSLAISDKTSAGNQKKFGTCVVILPTPLSGGTLLLRNADNKLVVDPEKMLQGKGIGHISYVAFGTDPKPEVKKESEGYCVIITYSLYLSDGTQTSDVEYLSSEPFVTALSKLLKDPKFLPKGGYLGFGLQQEY